MKLKLLVTPRKFSVAAFPSATQSHKKLQMAIKLMTEAAPLGKTSQTWLKGCHALVRWLFTPILIEEHRNIVMETLFLHLHVSRRHVGLNVSSSLASENGAS